MKKLALMLTTLVGLTFQGCYLEMIDSGEVGVQINSGVVQENPIHEGFNFSLNPMAELIIYNTKAKQLEMSEGNDKDTREIMNDSAVTILTKDNLQIPVDLTILYKLKDECAPFIRKEFGEDIDWDNKVVVPTARDTIRGVIGDADVYSLNQNRDKYAQLIKENLGSKINAAIRKECVSVEMVSIRDIRLPQQLMDSIMKKNQMEEDAKKAKLEVEKAKAEAEIEVARAEGTAKAQQALTKSINADLIHWKELEIRQQAIHKWDGKLPVTTAGGTIPFLQIK